MARNIKKDYLKKLLNTTTPNGYKFDIANYLYNPHLTYEYPSFTKTLKEDESMKTIRRVYYFKYYDGTGEYIAETYDIPTNGDKWEIARNRKEETLGTANRFNVNALIAYC